MQQFLPIDLHNHLELCRQFREDSYRCSFGTTSLFYEHFGEKGERYGIWLQEKLEYLPGSAMHLWLDAEIIGQVELDIYDPEPQCGYVNLFYLKPEYRNRGIGQFLEEYAQQYFLSLGLRKARLSVALAQEQALRFYRKHNWEDRGAGAVSGTRILEKIYRLSVPMGFLV